MEDRGGDAVVGGELGELGGGALGDDGAGDEAGGVGAVELVEGVDGGFGLASGHGFLGKAVSFRVASSWVSGCKSGVFSPVSGCAGLEDGEEGGEEVDLDAGDGGEAEQAIFDLGGELGVGGVVGGRGRGG